MAPRNPHIELTFVQLHMQAFARRHLRCLRQHIRAAAHNGKAHTHDMTRVAALDDAFGNGKTLPLGLDTPLHRRRKLFAKQVHTRTSRRNNSSSPVRHIRRQTLQMQSLGTRTRLGHLAQPPRRLIEPRLAARHTLRKPRRHRRRGLKRRMCHHVGHTRILS